MLLRVGSMESVRFLEGNGGVTKKQLAPEVEIQGYSGRPPKEIHGKHPRPKE